MRNLSCHSPMPSRSTLHFAFLLPQTVLSSKQDRGYHSGLFLGQTPASGIFPFVILLCQLFSLISLRAGQAFHSWELSQLFSSSHILQAEDFLQCLWYLKIFTKPFFICSACAKILLHVLKNLKFQLFQWCALHTASS